MRHLRALGGLRGLRGFRCADTLRDRLRLFVAKGIGVLSWIVACSAWGAAGQVETRYSSSSTSGSAFVNPASNSGPKVANQVSVISFRTPGFLKNSLVVTGSVTNTKNDYSAVILTSASGEKTPLSGSFNKLETSAEAGLEWRQGPHTTNLSYAQMLSDSPYPFTAAALSYNRSFYTNSTVLGADYNVSHQNTPKTFFDDPSDSFHSKERPDSLHAHRIVLWYEQILSERYKTQFRWLEGQREDRPQHIGLEWRNSYTLLDKVFARVDLGHLSERREQALRNERGYLNVSWAEAQLTYEPIYDLLLTASIGTTVEREDIPWDRDVNGLTRKNQFAADIYGLRLSYKAKRWSAGLQAQSGAANTSYRSSTYSGNFIWEL